MGNVVPLKEFQNGLNEISEAKMSGFFSKDFYVKCTSQKIFQFADFVGFKKYEIRKLFNIFDFRKEY